MFKALAGTVLAVALAAIPSAAQTDAAAPSGSAIQSSAQSPPAAQPAPSPTAPASSPAQPASFSEIVAIAAGKPVQAGVPLKAATLRDQRKAAKLYLEGVKFLEKKQSEPAWRLLTQAAELEPSNGTYVTAAELARQSTLTQLVELASQKHLTGDTAGATLLLQRALEIDPKDQAALDHLRQFAVEVGSADVGQTSSLAGGFQDVSKGNLPGSVLASGPILLEPSPGKHSFHLRNDAKQVVQQVFHAYGIDASVHDSVQSRLTRLDVDDATFPEAMRVLSMLTQTFYEPLDPHRVLVAKDTRANRTEFQRQQMETIYLPGLTDKELTDVSNLARNVFDAQQSVAEPTAGTLTLRAPAKTLAAFNNTVGPLVDGKNQLELNVKVIQLAHVSARETGTTFFQQTGVYNAFSEIQSVLSQNQSLVQQVIASGLVANSSTLANQIEILAILVASGQVTGTPFNQGFLPFGGGLTQSLLVPGPATLALSLNSSDTRTLDDINLRLEDDEAGTFKTGMRYPIEQSSYSSVALPAALSAVLGTNGSAQTIPQIQYEDLGLTLKATPKVLRSNDVALTVDLKIESLGGASLNNIPILNSQQFTGVLTLQAGETAVLLSDLSRQESRALSGLPGIGDIPGLQDVSDITKNQNVARLMILVTPHVVRNPKILAHGPILAIDKPAH